MRLDCWTTWAKSGDTVGVVKLEEGVDGWRAGAVLIASRSVFIHVCRRDNCCICVFCCSWFRIIFYRRASVLLFLQCVLIMWSSSLEIVLDFSLQTLHLSPEKLESSSAKKVLSMFPQILRGCYCLFKGNWLQGFPERRWLSDCYRGFWRRVWGFLFIQGDHYLVILSLLRYNFQ